MSVPDDDVAALAYHIASLANLITTITDDAARVTLANRVHDGAISIAHRRQSDAPRP